MPTMTPPVQHGPSWRTWNGTARGDNGRTRVTVVWEQLAQAPGGRREALGRVSVMATARNGSELFRGPGPDVQNAAAAPPRRRFVFEAPPGRVELRVIVEAAGGETLDRETRSIDVPDLSASDPAISTPQVHRGRTAREMQSIAADRAAVPVVAGEFARTERLLIRFDVYAPRSEERRVG